MSRGGQKPVADPEPELPGSVCKEADGMLRFSGQKMKHTITCRLKQSGTGRVILFCQYPNPTEKQVNYGKKTK